MTTMSLPSIFSSSLFPSNPPQPSSPENPRLSSSSAAGSLSGGISGVRIPTAPWMTSPLILPADQILNLSKPRKKNPSADDEEKSSIQFLTSSVPGGRSRHAMRKILKGISFLRKTLPQSPFPERVSADFSVLDSLDAVSPGGEAPWAKAEEEGGVAIPRSKKNRILPAAELGLPAAELDRMREEAGRMKKWIRGKKAGVTSEVVKGIGREWRRNELAMVKIVDPLRRNMARAHEIVEVCGNFMCFDSSCKIGSISEVWTLLISNVRLSLNNLALV